MKIAILSTGVDYLHEDLQKNLYFNFREMEAVAKGDTTFSNGIDEDGNGVIDDIVGYDVVDRDGYPYDRHGAGTAVAGIIGASAHNGLGTKGILEKVSMYPIRYISDSGQTDVRLLVDALRLAVKVDPDVIYVQTVDIKKMMVFEREYLKTVLDTLSAKDIPIVIPAGNGNTMLAAESLQALFANYPNVFIVTSHTQTGRKPLLANYHPQHVVIAAPGKNILTTGMDNSYREVGSTSYAAAMLAGALCLAKSEFGNVSTQALKAALGLPEGGDYLDGFEHYTTSGNMLNLKKFLGVLQGL